MRRFPILEGDVADASTGHEQRQCNGNISPAQRAVWRDATAFTTDADGHFLVDGLKPSVRNSVGVAAKTRANYRLDTGRVFRDIVLKKFGEVRDLGDIKVKIGPSNQ